MLKDNLQIIWNYLIIFFIPCIAGILVRLLLKRFSKSWILTAASAIATIISLIISLDPPVSGSELYGLITVQIALFTVGSFVTGMIIYGKRKNKVQSS